MDMNRTQQEHTLFNGKTLALKKTDKNKSVQIFIHDEKKLPTSSSKYLALIHKKQVQKPLLGTFDILLCLLVLAPCVVGFWRGTWDLMDHHAEYFTYWLCYFTGIGIHIFFVLTQDVLNDVMKNKSSNLRTKIFKMAVTRVYTYIFAISSVMQWRGGWGLIDEFFGIVKVGDRATVTNGKHVLATIGCLVGMIALRSIKSSISAPFMFCIDGKYRTFSIPNRFKTKMSERTSLYILDCLFSVLVIGTLVVFVWRGAWALIDIYLFPDNEKWSAWGSLIVGYSSVAIAFMLQPFMKWLCDRVTGVSRLLVADMFLIISLIGTINVWRGIWNLLNIYLLPDNIELSCWITHWVCLIILILLGCSNSLLVRGVYIDAEEPAGKCVVFPCYYLRMIFQEQKLKKIQSEQSKSEMVNVKPCENNHIVSVQNTNEQYPQTLTINHKEGDV